MMRPTKCPECGAQVPDSYFDFIHHVDHPGLDGKIATYCMAGHRIILDENKPIKSGGKDG